jgi:hypothetical protein
MGVKAKRFGLAALALGAVLLPFRKVSPPPADGADEREGRYLGLTQELRDARVRVTALIARDSVLAKLPSLSRTGPEPQLVLGGFPQQTRTDEFQSRLATIWKALGQTDTSVSTAIYVYNEANEGKDLSQVFWSSYWGNLITQREKRIVCVTILPGERAPDGRLVVSNGLLSVATAPCNLFLTFGNPGASIAAWLNATRFVSARSSAWLIPERQYETGPWGWLRSRAVSSSRYKPIGLPVLGEFQVAEQLAPPYRLGAAGIRCLVGDEGSCEKSVLHSAVTEVRDPGVPRDLTVDITLLKPDSLTLTTVRPPGGSFLSQLIKEKGREEFGTFWRSDLPFEESFKAAFGESLGHWTAHWARTQWDKSWEVHYGGGATIRLGTTLSASWPLIVLAWTALALAAVSWAAYRKQVTL